MTQVCDQCVAEVGADHASIGIATGPAQLVPGAASSPDAAGLEEYAFVVGEGPCFDAMHEHAPVLAPDLDAHSAQARWPAWSEAAATRRIRAAVALPIEAGALTAGVLSLYSSSVWQPDGRQIHTAHRLVGVALLALLDMALSVAETEDLDVSLNGHAEELSVLLRADVHRAAGMIMAQADLPIDQALLRLRGHAFAVGRPLPDVAADVLARRLRFDSGADSAQ